MSVAEVPVRMMKRYAENFQFFIQSLFSLFNDDSTNIHD